MIPITPLENWVLNKISCKGDPLYLTKSAIESFQLKKIKETISYVKVKSPFYKKLLSGFGSDSIKTLKDLSMLPFTCSDDIRNNALPFLCISQSAVKRCVTLQSSATTGASKRIFFTEKDLEQTLDFFHHGMSTLVEAGDRVMILLPGDKPDSVGDLLSRALMRMNIKSIIHGFVANPKITADSILKHEITCLVGTPVQVLAIFRCGEWEEYLKCKRMKVLLTTDYVPDVITRILEKEYNCEVYSHYGMSEMGYGGGVECSARCGHHMREADLYIEIIDPKTGEMLPDGETGEIVLTTLNREAMPLIRYRTGDISRFITKPCSCGTVLKRLDKIFYRKNGIIYLSSGKPLFMSLFDEALFEISDIMDYSAVFTKNNNKINLEIILCITDIINQEEVCAAVKKKINKFLQITNSKEQFFLKRIKCLSNIILSSGIKKRVLSVNQK